MNTGQKEAFQAAKEGHSFLLSGAAGTGKSWITSKIITELREYGSKVLVCCSTGIACLQYSHFCHSRTLHHTFGLWDGRYTSSLLRYLFDSDDAYQKKKLDIEEADVLIIDEISMVSQKILDNVESICRHLKDPSLVMGGLQVILVGDFFQLSSVPNKLFDDAGQRCFHHPLFSQIAPHTIFLGEVMRQDEMMLIEASNEFAWGKVSENSLAFLQSLQRPLPIPPFEVTHLCALNIEVGLYNAAMLADVQTQGMTYRAEDSGEEKLLRKMLVEKELQLKVGVPVMLLRNVPNSQLFNGLRGKVLSLTRESVTVNFPQIRVKHKFTKETFTQFDPKRGCDAATRIQIPLKLAYAITIHKSQGLTLEWVEVDCAGLFASGQLGVAISRVKSCEGLRVLNFNPKRHIIEPHSDVVDFYSTSRHPLDLNNNCCQKRPVIEPRSACHEPEMITELPADDESEPATDEELIKILAELASDNEISDISLESVSASGSDEELEDVIQMPVCSVVESVKEKDVTPKCQLTAVPCKVDAVVLLEELIYKNPLTKEQEENNQGIAELKINPVMQCIVDCCLVSLNKIWEDTKLCKGAKHTDLKAFYMAFDDYLLGEYTTVCLKNELSGKPKSIILNKLLFKVREIFVKHERTILSPKGCDMLQIEFKMSDDGKGKVRYMAGRSVSLVRKQIVKKLHSQLKSSRGTAKSVAFTQRCLAHLHHMRTHVGALNKGSLASTVEETERRQNIGGGLTHVTDETYLFYMELEAIRQQQHTYSRARELQGDVLFDSRGIILDSELLRHKFSDIFVDYYAANVDVMEELLEMMVDRYIVVANNEFRKKLSSKFGKRKKLHHRAEIYKRKGCKNSEKEQQPQVEASAPTSSVSVKQKGKRQRKARNQGTKKTASAESVSLKEQANIKVLTVSENIKISEEFTRKMPLEVPGVSASSLDTCMEISIETDDNKVSIEKAENINDKCSTAEEQKEKQAEEKTDDETTLYCLCKEISHGKMVGCDNDSCIVEWFHFSCVGLKKKPRGKWFCPNCRGKRSNLIRDDLKK